MTKPADFRQQRVILSDTPYEVQEEYQKGPFSGSGVLTIGRVVWVNDACWVKDGLAKAFADGIGVVAIKAESVAHAS